MKVQAGIWSALTGVVVTLLVALFFVGGAVTLYQWYKPLIEKNRRYRQDILALEARIAAEERLARHYREAIESLQNDPRTVERLVREKLGYARSNETVVRLEPAIRR